MDGVHLPQGYRPTTTEQFTFYHQVPRNCWHSIDRPRKDERLSCPWIHQGVIKVYQLWKTMINLVNYDYSLEPPSGSEHGTHDL